MAQIADPGSGIKNNMLTVGIHLEAICVAAKGDLVGLRTRDAAVSAPKFEVKTQ